MLHTAGASTISIGRGRQPTSAATADALTDAWTRAGGIVVDIELITAPRDAVPVPLVLPGSAGVADAGLVAAVRADMVMVNIATPPNQVFTDAMTARLAQAHTVDTRRYLGRSDAVTAEAAG